MRTLAVDASGGPRGLTITNVKELPRAVHGFAAQLWRRMKTSHGPMS